MDAGLITPGKIDDRPIQELSPDDLRGYDRCHFFAGIAGWELALRLAEWDSRPVWTGSCPCQPFSAAGKSTTQSDERHLWPYWARLIRECRPSTIFSEQVDDAIAAGWLDDAFRDLEVEKYTCAAAVLPACSVSLPHRRDRIFLVADAHRERCLVWGLPAGNGIEEHCEKESGFALSVSSDDNRPRFWWRVEPGMGRVADGVPARVDKLRAFGNAIVPQVAAEFIRAYREC